MGLKSTDGRLLSPQEQEVLRRRVVAAVKDGMTQTQAAKVFGVSLRSVAGWMKTVRGKGERGLRSGTRGQRPEVQKALSAWQQRKLARAIKDHVPADFGLTGFLWTRAVVGDLIWARHGIRLSLPTIGKYLAGWGLSFQKPVRRAYERDPRYPGLASGFLQTPPHDDALASGSELEPPPPPGDFHPQTTAHAGRTTGGTRRRSRSGSGVPGVFPQAGRVRSSTIRTLMVSSRCWARLSG
jgi:transposase